MIDVVFLLLFLIVLVAMGKWRWGLALCTLMAVLQDPLRKLIPDQPVYFVIFVGIVFGAALLGALLTRVPMKPNSINGWKHYVGKPYLIFMVLVIIQAAHSFIRFGNPMMTAIGLLFYFAPLPAVVFGYQFAVRRGLQGLSGWMWFYVFAAGIALSGVYLEFIGYEWKVLGEVGEGLIIYDVSTSLKAYSGFFRSSEIAAWHAGTIACFGFVLLVGRGMTLPRLLLSLALIVFLFGLASLTGRRKMLVTVAIFISVYFMLNAWFKRGAGKLAVIAGLTALLSFVAIIGIVNPDPGERSFNSHRLSVASNEKYKAYALRSRSVIQDIPDRFTNMGVDPVIWAVNSYGVFGAGLGTGSQGVQHYIAEDAINRGAAEGGLGKFTMELGIPGLILAIWLIGALFRYFWRVLGYLSGTSPRHARLGYGMFAFLTANAVSFSVAAQAYGDLFILLNIGWAAGFILALPVLAKASVEAESQASAARSFK